MFRFKKVEIQKGKMNKIKGYGVDSSGPDQGQWRAAVTTVMNFRVP